MPSAKRSGNPFIVSTGMEKVDSKTRRLIRSHVMLGKNVGKSQPAKRRSPKDPPKKSGDIVSSNDGPEDPLGVLVRTSRSSIPNRVGSDLSFIQFADTVQPATLADLLKFTSVAKEILFPLESCFIFERKDKRWFDPLTFDAAYLNAIVFSTRAYIDFMSGHKTPIISQAATLYFTKTIRLLRERLLLADEQANVSDSTVFVILTLAMVSHQFGGHFSARYHLEGLHRIVTLRGGLESFGYIPKLLIEILRCDIGMALHTGAKPLFSLDNISESFMHYPDQTLAFMPERTPPMDLQYHHTEFPDVLDDDLTTAWKVLQRFCRMINLAAETKYKFPQETLLHTMATVMYRLLHMQFAPGSVDEAIRLGLLAFSSNIFLQLQNVKPPYIYLPNAFRCCLLELQLPRERPSRLLLWLLFIGALSVFSDPDADAWLKPWLQSEVQSSGVHSWRELREGLKSFLWIDIVHDKPGQRIFDSIVENPQGLRPALGGL
ncbi:hypothetical protein BP6252_02038 [Coleophoma cylindrospora]|uniref:Uncharacterized protein n=1 Tax=Coleophoma cylindrospora TaxID=1849047 RepID=A0A3D8SFB2_9HELO|nr:hypothetical protein BP6252_02038 [Coleophoma cylindrospora]